MWRDFMMGDLWAEDEKRRASMEKNGFVYDSYTRRFVKNGKAFYSNIPQIFNSLEDLQKFIEDNPDNHELDWILAMIADGYKISFDHTAPSVSGSEVEGTGVYIENYVEMFKRHEGRVVGTHETVRNALRDTDLERTYGDAPKEATATELSLREAFRESGLRALKKAIEDNKEKPQ